MEFPPIRPPSEGDLKSNPGLQIPDVQALNQSIPTFEGKPLFWIYLESGDLENEEAPKVICYVWHNFNNTAETSLEQLKQLIERCSEFRTKLAAFHGFAADFVNQGKKIEDLLLLIPALVQIIDYASKGTGILDVLETAASMALKSYETEWENRIELQQKKSPAA